MKFTPPATGPEALAWVQEALTGRRYVVGTHFMDRLADRDIPWRAAWHAIHNARACAPYAPDRGAIAGGSCWRITGPDQEGTATSVGVEAFVDHLGRRALLVTVF